MFDNIGGKIKTLAAVLCYIGIIASLMIAIVLWTQNSYHNATVALGFGVLIGGCIGSWVGSFFMYGFGELIEETTLTRQINQQILQRLGGADEKERSGSAPVRDVPVAFTNPTRQSKVAPIHTTVTSGGWMCKKCGTRNGSNDISCKDCGAYK